MTKWQFEENYKSFVFMYIYLNKKILLLYDVRTYVGTYLET